MSLVVLVINHDCKVNYVKDTFLLCYTHVNKLPRTGPNLTGLKSSFDFVFPNSNELRTNEVGC